eukprot:162512_1
MYSHMRMIDDIHLFHSIITPCPSLAILCAPTAPLFHTFLRGILVLCDAMSDIGSTYSSHLHPLQTHQSQISNLIFLHPRKASYKLMRRMSTVFASNKTIHIIIFSLQTHRLMHSLNPFNVSNE